MTSTRFWDFLTLSPPLCPRNLYCLSANLLHILTPLPGPLLCGRHIWKHPRIVEEAPQTRFFLQFRSAALFPPKSPPDKQVTNDVHRRQWCGKQLPLRKRITRSTCCPAQTTDRGGEDIAQVALFQLPGQVNRWRGREGEGEGRFSIRQKWIERGT